MNAPIPAPNLSYRSAFASTSVGTEQELDSSVYVVFPNQEKATQLLALVRRRADVLAEITVDMSQDTGPHTSGTRYTIELRSTPYEMADDARRQLRIAALTFAVQAIEASHNAPIASDPYRGFTLQLLHPAHEVRWTGPRRTVATPPGAQLTMGVAVADLLNAGPSDYATYVRPQLHWLQDHNAPRGVTPAGAAAHSFVMSALTHLAQRLYATARDNPNVREAVIQPNLVTVKDSWSVMPRTPPIRILDALPATEREKIVQAIQNAQPPDGADALRQKWWGLTRDRIMRGGPMGGHPQRAATVRGDPAFLFEFRSAYDVRAPRNHAQFDPGEAMLGPFLWSTEASGSAYDPYPDPQPPANSAQ